MLPFLLQYFNFEVMIVHSAYLTQQARSSGLHTTRYTWYRYVCADGLLNYIRLMQYSQHNAYCHNAQTTTSIPSSLQLVSSILGGTLLYKSAAAMINERVLRTCASIRVSNQSKPQPGEQRNSKV